MAVEMSMIGFMVGTCIAFFVVIGDLAPPIIATLIDVVPSQNLRIFVLFGKKNYSALRNIQPWWLGGRVVD